MLRAGWNTVIFLAARSVWVAQWTGRSYTTAMHNRPEGTIRGSNDGGASIARVDRRGPSLAGTEGPWWRVRLDLVSGDHSSRVPTTGSRARRYNLSTRGRDGMGMVISPAADVDGQRRPGGVVCWRPRSRVTISITHGA